MQTSTSNVQCQLPNYAPRHSKMPYKLTALAITLVWTIAALATLGSLQHKSETLAEAPKSDGPAQTVDLKPTQTASSKTVDEVHTVAMRTGEQPQPTKPVCRAIAGSTLQPC
ncbi:MAG: hypothetical protein AAFR75_07410 [Pseudomonadota bacterium]